jgi:hypothetical protein
MLYDRRTFPLDEKARALMSAMDRKRSFADERKSCPIHPRLSHRLVDGQRTGDPGHRNQHRNGAFCSSRLARGFADISARISAQICHPRCHPRVPRNCHPRCRHLPSAGPGRRGMKVVHQEPEGQSVRQIAPCADDNIQVVQLPERGRGAELTEPRTYGPSTRRRKRDATRVEFIEHVSRSRGISRVEKGFEHANSHRMPERVGALIAGPVERRQCGSACKRLRRQDDHGSHGSCPVCRSYEHNHEGELSGHQQLVEVGRGTFSGCGGTPIATAPRTSPSAVIENTTGRTIQMRLVVLCVLGVI